MKSENLIKQLIEQTRVNVNEVEKLKNKDSKLLKWRENDGSWCILECLEHLNLYGNYYLPQIEKAINDTNHKSENEFKSSYLGNYCAKSMLPKEKLNKMKTFKDKNPLNTIIDETVIETCIIQQLKIIDLLNTSRNVSLNKVKISTSISKFIKLKLGDTFQFIINHNIRHLKQIENIIKKTSITTH